MTLVTTLVTRFAPNHDLRLSSAVFHGNNSLLGMRRKLHKDRKRSDKDVVMEYREGGME